MALADALHHSSGPSKKKVVERCERQDQVGHETHYAPRGPKTPPPGQRRGLLSEPAPQERLEAAARVLVMLPTLAMPSLAGAGGEAVDASTLAFLSRKAVEERMEEKRKEEEAKKVEEMRQAKREEEEKDPDGWQQALDSDGAR